MSKSEKDILELGHKILVFQGTARLGTKPGYFDLWAGEEDIRRVIIDGENVDPNSDAYKDLCKKAHSDFAENKDAEKLLEKVENFYNALEEVAKKRDQPEWSRILTSSILLGGTVSAQVASTSRPLLKTKTSTPSSEALVGEQAHGDTAAGTNLFNSFPLISDELRQSASSLAIFAASKLAGTSTLTAAALSTLSAFPMIEAKDDDSMIVFGFGMHGLQNFMIPDELLDAAKKSKINFYSADIQSSDHHLNIKANRLILVGHGNDNGDGTQRVEMDRSLRIDKFAKEFFSDAKILHTIGCKLAVNPKRNFKKNSLKNGQILFIHSGETNIGASSMMDIGS